ncbi:MAG: sigma-70 family RNA polymerase sigma factor [Ktedonobacteraceae bacterium]|nr:sigma-70 family RNA polymerase sigma factor [Ktedonobacteraceae bacterium]
MHLMALDNESLSEAELFDLLTFCPLASPEQDVEANEQAMMMLALVSSEDQHVLRMAFLEDFDREGMAKRLGITEVAARKRLHRALNRLRTAWYKQQEGERNE